MTFLLTGHGGCFNRGCEAILRTTIMMLRSEFKQPKILISSADYINDRKIYFGNDVEIIPSRLDGLWRRWTGPWILRQLCNLYSKEKSLQLEYLPIISAIKKADVVLSVGGDNFTMDYGFPDYFLGLNRLVKKKKKKIVIWAASIGPFNDDERLGEIIDNLKSVDLINIRETYSLNYLKQLGITKNIRLVADSAFLLPVESIPLGTNWPTNTKGAIGVNISNLLHKYIDKDDDGRLIENISLPLRKIINKTGLYVVLIPHVVKNTSMINNDYAFMGNIYEALKDTKMIARITPDYNAMQTKYIISKCRFFIGARTHSTIASLSMGVPTLSLGYSLKARGINNDIFGNQDFLLNVNDVTAENFFNKFMSLYSRELEVHKLLSEKIPAIKEAAWTNIKYLKKIL